MPGPQLNSEPTEAQSGAVVHAAASQIDISGYEPPPTAPKNPLNIARVRAALVRFKWLILVIVVAGTTAGVVATRFIEPVYSADAIIWIQSPNQPRGPIRPAELLQSENWPDLIRTFTVLDPVVHTERLYLEVEGTENWPLFKDISLAERFAPGQYELTVDKAGRSWSLASATGGRPIGSGPPGDSIGREVGFKWAPSPALLGRDRKIAFSLITPREASASLNGRLRVTSTREGSFLRLGLVDTEGDRAASTLNSLLHRFVGVAADLKRDNLTKLRLTLEEQVQQADSTLKQAEEQLESYRVRTITLPGETIIASTPGLQSTQAPALRSYFAEREELERVRRDRRAIETVLKNAESGGLAIDAFKTINAVQAAPDLGRVLEELSTAEAHLRDSLARYTTEYPGVKRLQDRIGAIRGQVIPAYAQALVARLKEMEGESELRITGASGELQSIPIRTMTEQRLQREVDAKRRLFSDLQAKHEEAKLAELSTIPDVSILDTAVAKGAPSGNTAGRIVMLAFLGSLGAALALALLLDRMDSRFRYPEQASDDLGLTILGAVPAISHSRNGRFNPEDAAQLIESFRSIRLNLAHSYTSSGPILLTISSPGAGDGKSLVSTNLALSFAEAGYRTILVDGDTRRGELHRTFAAERRPGLLDHLAGSAGSNQIIRSTSHENLTLIPCGSRKQSGPELLGSARMSALMADLRGRYDVIVVDSPPLGAGIDPFVLGTLSGSLMLVLRAGETDREMAESRLKIIDRLPIRLLGAVLNDIRAGGGTYKYYSYLSGYAAEEEFAGEGATPKKVPSNTSG